eukprot:2288127-Rhodomonas_salina.1
MSRSGLRRWVRPRGHTGQLRLGQREDEGVREREGEEASEDEGGLHIATFHDRRAIAHANSLLCSKSAPDFCMIPTMSQHVCKLHPQG